MKSLKGAIIGMAVFAMLVSLSGLAFAEMGCSVCKEGRMDKEAFAANIKVLRDSAAALQATNPDLAKGLNDLADKKAEMMQKWQERAAKYDAKKKLLKDSAVALQAINPDLAKELQKISEKKHMEKGPGEMAEPR